MARFRKMYRVTELNVIRIWIKWVLSFIPQVTAPRTEGETDDDNHDDVPRGGSGEHDPLQLLRRRPRRHRHRQQGYLAQLLWFPAGELEAMRDHSHRDSPQMGVGNEWVMQHGFNGYMYIIYLI